MMIGCANILFPYAREVVFGRGDALWLPAGSSCPGQFRGALPGPEATGRERNGPIMATKRSNRAGKAVLLSLASAFTAPAARAVDYRSVAAPAIFSIRLGPGKRLFIIASGTPVERSCRSTNGTGARFGRYHQLIERKAPQQKRTVQVTAERVAVRSAG